MLRKQHCFWFSCIRIIREQTALTCLLDLGVAPHEFDCDLPRSVRDDISANSMSGWSVQREVFYPLLTFNFNVTNPSGSALETGPST